MVLCYHKLALESKIVMNRDFSLLDANLNRAEEGLRVIEDICRFVLRQPVLWAKLKELRHGLQDAGQIFGWANTLSGRQEDDFGKEKVVESEYNRTNLAGIIQANVARTTQSVRALEEFAKIYNQNLSYKLENIRYELYVWEYKLLVLTPHYWLNKYFEQGIVYPISDSVEELVWLVNHGAKIMQLRDKQASRREVYEKVKYLCEYVQKIKIENKIKDKVLLILNDDIEIASKLPVAGVHIGQDGDIIKQVRKIIGSDKIIGRSNHSMKQIKQSAEDGADYCSIGPIFETPTKAGRPAVGLEIISQVAKEIRIPWLVIGGINKDNLNEVKNVGAQNIAVVRSAREFFSID